MTVEGEESLRTELQHLITDVRPNITKKLPKQENLAISKKMPNIMPPKNSKVLPKQG